ncbi:MAG: hypothetical protein JWR35_3798 [Marmoricola sp.]|nr:hypothetical protein [Marmoricola sp.]
MREYLHTGVGIGIALARAQPISSGCRKRGRDGEKRRPELDRKCGSIPSNHYGLLSLRLCFLVVRSAGR